MEWSLRDVVVPNLSSVARAVEATLQKCRSTDFGEKGLNEAGFKAVVLSNLSLFEEQGWTIESECCVHLLSEKRDGYVDILLVHAAKRAKVVLELKYVSAFWLDLHEVHRGVPDSTQRTLLEDTVSNVGALFGENPRNLLLLQTRHAGLNRSVPVGYYLGEAVTQASAYGLSIQELGWQVISAAIVCVTNKLLIRVLKESLIPDDKDVEKFLFEKRMPDLKPKILPSRVLVRLCQRCGRDSHEATNCYAKTVVAGHKPSGNNCFRCGRKGHWVSDCYAKTHTNGDRL